MVKDLVLCWLLAEGCLEMPHSPCPMGFLDRTIYFFKEMLSL